MNSGYFKLIDAIDTPQTLNVPRRKNGVIHYGHVKIYPGKKYELGDDEIFIKALKNARITKQHSKELVETLNRLKVPFDEKFCGSCGGRVKKISYAVVEVVENGT